MWHQDDVFPLLARPLPIIDSLMSSTESAGDAGRLDRD